MKPVLTAAVLACLALPLLSRSRAEKPAEEKVPTIVEIMEEAHRCRTAYVRLAGNECRKEEPDWSVVETRGKELVRMGKLLAKNTPPRGTKESWEQLTTVYVAHATLLEDAGRRKDRESANYHVRKLTAMCNTCHKSHQPND
jgi:hypothetical protein